MTKWALFKANKSCNTSVLEQLSRAHKENVDRNRRYLRVIIECLMHNVQQNSPLRGHEESRDHIWEVSDKRQLYRNSSLSLQRFAMVEKHASKPA